MFLYLLPTILLIFSPAAYAYKIEDVSVDIRNDFVLSPAKIDVSLDPGAQTTKYLTITNRQEKEMSFDVGVEDFKGSQDPGRAIFLLGNQKGPYSLKDFLTPEISTFTLKPKQMITFPIAVSIPKDASPGGLYGSVLISSIPSPGSSGAVAVSRLGALFFVRVNGNAIEEGKLMNFNLKGPKKFFYQKRTFAFEFLYKNTGNVHLSPYGVIRISNIFGQEVDSFEIQPYFTMPDSVRYREMTWNKNILLGRYKAEISLNRGYGNIVDTAEVSFIVLPWKILAASLLFVCFVLSVIHFIGSHFEIRMKRK